jgi:hypothetical protein
VLSPRCPGIASAGRDISASTGGSAQDGRGVGCAGKCLTDDGGEVVFAADVGRVPPGSSVPGAWAFRPVQESFPPEDHHHGHDGRVGRVLAVGGLVVHALAHHPDAQRLVGIPDHRHDRRLQRPQAGNPGSDGVHDETACSTGGEHLFGSCGIPLVRGLPSLTFNLFPGQWLFRGSWHVGFAWEKVAWHRPGAGSLGPARAGAARLIRSAVAC